MIYRSKDIYRDQDLLSYIYDNGGFECNGANPLEGFSFMEFTLEELGLPQADELLTGVLEIKNKVGLQGWVTAKGESKNYKGFSLTYNPDFSIADNSIYHQTWGSKKLNQSWGRKLGEDQNLKNTYYDSYAFRKQPPLIQEHLGSLLNKFRMPLVRSRVAFLNMQYASPSNTTWHVDEVPYQLFRINIPLQTEPEYILDINGADELGNKLTLRKHLEVGKVYIWNTRIPHKVDVSSVCTKPTDRIHLVLGFSPWFDYDPDQDGYVKSNLHGMKMIDIINQKLFLN